MPSRLGQKYAYCIYIYIGYTIRVVSVRDTNTIKSIDLQWDFAACGGNSVCFVLIFHSRHTHTLQRGVEIFMWIAIESVCVNKRKGTRVKQYSCSSTYCCFIIVIMIRMWCVQVYCVFHTNTKYSIYKKMFFSALNINSHAVSGPQWRNQAKVNSRIRSNWHLFTPQTK